MPYYATNAITGSTTAVALTGVQALRHPAIQSDDIGDVRCEHGTIIFASGVNLAINDVIELCVLPSDCVPVDFILLNDDFDTVTTVTIKIGLLAGTIGDSSRVIGSVGVEALASGSTALQAAGTLRNVSQTWPRVAPSTTDRSVALAVVAAPTNPATIRQLDFLLFFRASRYGA